MHAHIPVLYATDEERKQASTIRFWIFHRSLCSATLVLAACIPILHAANQASKQAKLVSGFVIAAIVLPRLCLLGHLVHVFVLFFLVEEGAYDACKKFWTLVRPRA
jgi:hypothetical protein